MLRGLTDLLSHVLHMGLIQQRLTCLSFRDIGVVGGGGGGGGGGSRPLSCGFGKSWVGMDGLTLCAWRAERRSSGSQVLALTRRPGRARSLR